MISRYGLSLSSTCILYQKVLYFSMNVIFFSFKDKADTFFTTQRLNYISNQTELLKPRITELKNVDLGEVTSAVKGLETNGKNLLRSVKSVEIYIQIIFNSFLEYRVGYVNAIKIYRLNLQQLIVTNKL